MIATRRCSWNNTPGLAWPIADAFAPSVFAFGTELLDAFRTPSRALAPAAASICEFLARRSGAAECDPHAHAPLEDGPLKEVRLPQNQLSCQTPA